MDDVYRGYIKPDSFNWKTFKEGEYVQFIAFYKRVSISFDKTGRLEKTRYNGIDYFDIEFPIVRTGKIIKLREDNRAMMVYSIDENRLFYAHENMSKVWKIEYKEKSSWINQVKQLCIFLKWRKKKVF